MVHFEAERLDDTTVKPTLDEFGVLGLPTFVIVEPGRGAPRPGTVPSREAGLLQRA